MKRVLTVITALFFLICLSPAVYAATESVVDDADLLSDGQEANLSQLAQKLRDAYDMDVVIHTVWSLGGKSPEGYADDYYDDNGYGVGADYSGVIFVLSMEYRDWAVSTCGEAIDALSDRDLDELLYSMSQNLSDGEYYEAFLTYLDGLEDCLQDYQESLAPPDAGDYFKILIVSLLVGAGIGAVGLMVLRSTMNTAVAQSNAQSYFVNNSFILPVNQNTFLYSRTSKTSLPESNGGGSSTHRGSSGRSHGGRSGKF